MWNIYILPSEPLNIFLVPKGIFLNWFLFQMLVGVVFIFWFCPSTSRKTESELENKKYLWKKAVKLRIILWTTFDDAVFDNTFECFPLVFVLRLLGKKEALKTHIWEMEISSVGGREFMKKHIIPDLGTVIRIHYYLNSLDYLWSLSSLPSLHFCTSLCDWSNAIFSAPELNFYTLGNNNAPWSSSFDTFCKSVVHKCSL